LLALSTRCAPADESLDRTVAALRDFGVGALALHRPPVPEEARGLRQMRKRPRIVAVFTDAAARDLGRPVLVVEGGPADEEDREASLLALCRKLHALREFDVALRTPDGDARHPSPHELVMVQSELKNTGYWHDTARGGDEYLDEAARWLKGASFHPLEYDDLGGLRDALPASAPAVVDCPPGTSNEELAEAIARARSVFGD
jgi:hypothetical protein